MIVRRPAAYAADKRLRSYGAAYVFPIDPFKRRRWSEGSAAAGFPTGSASVFDADEP